MKIFISDTELTNTFIEDKGLKDLFRYPGFKALETNDWFDEDAIEVDLSNPVLDGREVTLPFIFTTKDALNTFLTLMNDNEGSHDFRFEGIWGVFTLFLVEETKREVVEELTYCTFKFLQNGYNYYETVYDLSCNATTSQDDFFMDAKKIGDFGVWVLEGSKAEVLKIDGNKPQYVEDNPEEQGKTYSFNNPYNTKSRVMNLKCHMGMSLNDFLNNFYALLHALIKTGSRECSMFGKTFSCYYKGINPSDLTIIDNDYIWFDFTLSLQTCLSTNSTHSAKIININIISNGDLTYNTQGEGVGLTIAKNGDLIVNGFNEDKYKIINGNLIYNGN